MRRSFGRLDRKDSDFYKSKRRERGRKGIRFQWGEAVNPDGLHSSSGAAIEKLIQRRQ